VPGSFTVTLPDEALPPLSGTGPLVANGVPVQAVPWYRLKVTVPVGEFEKLEGCVTCLSVRLRGI